MNCQRRSTSLRKWAGNFRSSSARASEEKTTLLGPLAVPFRSSNIVRMLRPSVVVALLYAAFLCLFSIIHGYSALDFVHLGTYWTPHKRPGTVGYDGQFYYQLARDPLGAQAFMDNVPYRYHRLVFPLDVRLLRPGQADLLRYLLLLDRSLSIVLRFEILSRLLVKHGLSPWFSLGVGLY